MQANERFDWIVETPTIALINSPYPSETVMSSLKAAVEDKSESSLTEEQVLNDVGAPRSGTATPNSLSDSVASLGSALETRVMRRLASSDDDEDGRSSDENGRESAATLRARRRRTGARGQARGASCRRRDPCGDARHLALSDDETSDAGV